MKDLLVPPSQLLISNEIDEGPVGIYAGLIARNVRGIHRVVVADLQTLLEWDRSPVVSRAWDRNPPLMRSASHIILEGNHRSSAYALFGEPVPCTVLEDDRDLEICRELSQTGEMGRFVHTTEDHELLVRDALEHAAHGYHGPTSVSELVRRCLQDEKLSIKMWPAYIKDRIVV